MVLSYYLWAGREFHWNFNEVDEMDLSDFFDVYVLTDKMNHPDDYLPAEFFFHP